MLSGKKVAVKFITYLGYLIFILLALVVISGWRGLMPGRMPLHLRPENLRLPYQTVQFAAPGGPILKGWLILSPEAAGSIIGLHGYPANKADILPTIAFLYPEYNLLLFDFRGMGESGGKITTLGFRESEDALAAVAYLRQKPETQEKPIGLWGYSLGGAVAILTAAQTKEVKAVVTDSAFATLPEMIEIYYGTVPFLKKPLSFLSCWLAKLLFQIDPQQVSPEKEIARLTCPILLIHNAGDPFVPAAHCRRLYRAAREPKEILLLNSTNHGGASSQDYEKRIRHFYQKYLD